MFYCYSEMMSPSQAGQHPTISSPNCCLAFRLLFTKPKALAMPGVSVLFDAEVVDPLLDLSAVSETLSIRSIGGRVYECECSILALRAVSDTCRLCLTDAGRSESTEKGRLGPPLR